MTNRQKILIRIGEIEVEEDIIEEKIHRLYHPSSRIKYLQERDSRLFAEKRELVAKLLK